MRQRPNTMRILKTSAAGALALVAMLLAPAAALAAYAPWVAQKSGTTQPLRGVAFVDPQDGWAVGGGGTILHTSNGGGSWTAQKSGTTQQLNAVVFADAATGWAVGNGGVILHTANGGVRWTLQKSGTTQPLNGVAFAGATTGWAVGGGGVVVRTTSGGAAWTAQTSGTTQALYGVACADASNCWVVGNRATVRHTTSGGATWSPQSAGMKKNDAVRSVSCSSASVAWISGNRGSVRKTTDGGSSWVAQSSGTGQTLYGSAAVDASSLRVVGSAGTVRATTNGGATWTAQTTPGTQTLSAVACPGTGHAWAVGNAGTIIAYKPDIAPPATTAVGLQSDKTSGWKNTPVSVTLSATEAGRAGFAATYYTLDGGGRLTYSAPFAVSAQGVHTVTYWSADQAGNVEDVHTGYVNIDTTPPTVGHDANGAWHADDVTVHLTAADAGGSGVAATQYRPAGSADWLTASGDAFVVDAGAVGDGSHSYEIRAVDAAGNASGTGACTVKMDVTPATTTATGLAGDEFSGWTDSAKTVSLAADDGAGSGVASIHYAVNGGVEHVYSAPFSISALGINHVTYWSVDQVGNKDQVRDGWVNIAAFYANAEGLAVDQVSGWHNGPVTVTLTAGGTPDPVLCYNVGGGADQVDQPSPVTLDFTAAGHHTITFWAKNAGGESVHQTGYVNIDVVKPATTLAAPAPRRWVNHDVKLTYQATDDAAGIDSTYTSVDGAAAVPGAELILAAPLTHAGDGVHSVRYWSVDRAGNAETAKSVTLKIDTRRPTTAAPYAAGVARLGTAKLRFVVKDKAPCARKATARIVVKNARNRVVKTIKKTVKTGFTSTASFRCKLAKGKYRFFVYATDPAGNKQVKVTSNRLTVR